MNDLYLFLVSYNQNAQFIQQYQRQRYDGKGEWITCWGDHCCQYNDSDNGMSLIFDQHAFLQYAENCITKLLTDRKSVV